MIAADEAMYSSKRLGKNRVVGYASTGESTDPTDPPAAPSRPPVSTPGFRPLPREGERWRPHGEERR
jgi:hypothetical protein